MIFRRGNTSGHTLSDQLSPGRCAVQINLPRIDLIDPFLAMLSITSFTQKKTKGSIRSIDRISKTILMPRLLPSRSFCHGMVSVNWCCATCMIHVGNSGEDLYMLQVLLNDQSIRNLLLLSPICTDLPPPRRSACLSSRSLVGQYGLLSCIHTRSLRG